MDEPTNAEVLGEGLKQFGMREDFIQEEIAEYINCPSVYPCSYDGGSNHDCCIQCKIKWLLGKWKG